MRIAVLGGTGPEGLGIAARLAAAGETVVIGSRSAERAGEAVAKLRGKLPEGRLASAANAEAAAQAELVFVTVPFAGLDAVIESTGAALVDKVVVDATVPLRMENGFFRPALVPEGSASERLQARVPAARVVGAFKHQSAADLIAIERPIDGDVILCGNDDGARELVAGIVRRIASLRPVDAGDLRVAGIIEAMTPLLLNLNHRAKARTSIRILGL